VVHVLIRRIGIIVVAGLIGAPPGPGRAEDGAGLPRLTDEQVRLILGHGPWPAPWTADPSNRVSGNAEAIGLGRRLFFDARLAPSGRLSCSSCHRPERGWTDGRALGIGLEPGNRNTLALYNVRLNRRFGWSGRTDSLWAQSLRPLIDPKEMGSSPLHVRQHLGADRDLARAYETVFRRPVLDTDAEVVLVDAAKALAAYLETIDSARTAFDEFRDALAFGDVASAARYPLAAQRGLAIFIGKGACYSCHAGPAFTDGRLHDIGVAPDSDGSIALLLATRYGLAGPFNDARPTRHVEGKRGPGGVRVPTLRNLTRTAPYMHDGALATLDDGVRRHRPNAAVGLDDREIAELVAFLETLSE
jgi:cytochrome c peroxidase